MSKTLFNHSYEEKMSPGKVEITTTQQKNNNAGNSGSFQLKKHVSSSFSSAGCTSIQYLTHAMHKQLTRMLQDLEHTSEIVS